MKIYTSTASRVVRMELSALAFECYKSGTVVTRRLPFVKTSIITCGVVLAEEKTCPKAGRTSDIFTSATYSPKQRAAIFPEAGVVGVQDSCRKVRCERQRQQQHKPMDKVDRFHLPVLAGCSIQHRVPGSGFYCSAKCEIPTRSDVTLLLSHLLALHNGGPVHARGAAAETRARQFQIRSDGDTIRGRTYRPGVGDIPFCRANKLLTPNIVKGYH